MPRKASKPKNPDVMDTMDILDAKTLDSLTTKLIEALTPTFRQMLKDEFELFKAEIHESLMNATAEKVENRCGALDEQVKCLKEENLSLRRQLNAVEQVTYQSILLVQGLPENTQDASKVGLRRNPADEVAFIDLVNDRMEVDLTCNDIQLRTRKDVVRWLYNSSARKCVIRSTKQKRNYLTSLISLKVLCSRKSLSILMNFYQAHVPRPMRRQGCW